MFYINRDLIMKPNVIEFIERKKRISNRLIEKKSVAKTTIMTSLSIFIISWITENLFA